jgi:hypothetical protein
MESTSEKPPQPEQQAKPGTYTVLKTAEPRAIVIHCSDPRFQDAFQKFIEGTLGLEKGKYIPFVVAGGAGALARPDSLPKEFKFMKERLELFREHFKSIDRIILINHEDCAYYKNLGRALSTLQSFHVHLPLDDMKLIEQVFARLLSHLGMQLDLYYAKFANDSHTQVTFEPIK